MSETKQEDLKSGELVEFNVGHEDGPLMQGIVRMKTAAGHIIEPLQQGHIPPMTQFFNIKKIDPNAVKK